MHRRRLLFVHGCQMAIRCVFNKLVFAILHLAQKSCKQVWRTQDALRTDSPGEELKERKVRIKIFRGYLWNKSRNENKSFLWLSHHAHPQASFALLCVTALDIGIKEKQPCIVTVSNLSNQSTSSSPIMALHWVMFHLCAKTATISSGGPPHLEFLIRQIMNSLWDQQLLMLITHFFYNFIAFISKAPHDEI